MNETKVYAKAAGGQLKLDIEDLFYSLDDVARARVAKHLAFDKRLVECVVKWLTTGEVSWDNPEWDQPGHDEENQDWWITSTGPILEEARKKLLPLRDQVVMQLVGDLIKERDQAKWRAEQYQTLCWKIHQRWFDREGPPPESNPSLSDYGHMPRRLTADEVKAWIERRRAEIEKGPAVT